MLNLTEQIFGQLRVLHEGSREDNPRRRRRWICQCCCGNLVTIRQENLVSGNSGSCGCLSKQLLSSRQRTHGKTKTREYRAWQHMRERCSDPKVHNYKNYGGRCISVCDEWNKSFERFYSDMGDCPERHTLERKNVNEGYSPDNCCWATLYTQSRNRTDNRLLTYDGKTKILTDWAAETGIKESTLRARIDLLKWTVEKAFSTPVK